MPSGAADLVRYMNAKRGDPYQTIISLYWSVSHATVQGVLAQIRNALVRLVAELHANMSRDQELPSAEAAAQAVSVVVTGKRSRVVVTTAQASGASTATASSQPQPAESDFWTRSRRLGAFVVGAFSVAAAVVAILQFF
jgi:hypothetical protein